MCRNLFIILTLSIATGQESSREAECHIVDRRNESAAGSEKIRLNPCTLHNSRLKQCRVKALVSTVLSAQDILNGAVSAGRCGSCMNSITEFYRTNSLAVEQAQQILSLHCTSDNTTDVLRFGLLFY